MSNPNFLADFWPVLAIMVTVLISVFGAVLGGNKYILGQMQKQMDLRFDLAEESRKTATHQWDSKFQTITEAATQWHAVELEIAKLRAELPERYLRREDFILHQSRIEAKLDGLAWKIENHQLRGDRNNA